MPMLLDGIPRAHAQTDGAGRLMRDEYETIPMFCPMCGGRLEQSERKE